jgi:hypothetical protein
MMITRLFMAQLNKVEPRMTLISADVQVDPVFVDPRVSA